MAALVHAIFPFRRFFICLTLTVFSLVFYRDSARHDMVFLSARSGTLTRMREKVPTHDGMSIVRLIYGSSFISASKRFHRGI